MKMKLHVVWMIALLLFLASKVEASGSYCEGPVGCFLFVIGLAMMSMFSAIQDMWVTLTGGPCFMNGPCGSHGECFAEGDTGEAECRCYPGWGGEDWQDCSLQCASGLNGPSCKLCESDFEPVTVDPCGEHQHCEFSPYDYGI